MSIRRINNFGIRKLSGKAVDASTRRQALKQRDLAPLHVCVHRLLQEYMTHFPREMLLQIDVRRIKAFQYYNFNITILYYFF